MSFLGIDSVLGIEDPWVWGAYVLCILSTLLCIFYGLLRWDRGLLDEEEEIEEELSWEKKEDKMEKEELGVA